MNFTEEPEDVCFVITIAAVIRHEINEGGSVR